MAMRKLGTIDSHVLDMEKNAIKRSSCLFLFCSSVILENHQKILSFNKNYMNTTETSILFASRGLYLISGLQNAKFHVICCIQIIQLLLSSISL